MDPRAAPRSDDDLPTPFPRDAFDPVGEPVVVRLGDSGDLAAALPAMLGFHPVESVVLAALGGRSGRRITLTARVDIPRPEHARALAAQLAARVAQEDPDCAVLAVVSEDPDVRVLHDELPADDPWTDDLDEPLHDLPHRRLVHELLVALDAQGIPLDEALLVRGGRWWSYDCALACCAPGGGTPVPGGTTPLAAATVVSGRVLARDREEVAGRIARTGPLEAAVMADAIDRVGQELADLVLDVGRDAAAEVHTAAVDAAVARCGLTGLGVRVPDDGVARVVWGLRDVRVRDRAMGHAIGPDAAAAERLWTECVRRAPAPLDAAPATLLAISVWLRGDGTSARIALDRALDSDPGYSLAVLLSHGLDAGLRPSDLQLMVEQTRLDLDDPDGAPGRQEEYAAAIRAARAAATPARARARRGRPARSRTRRPRSQG